MRGLNERMNGRVKEPRRHEATLAPTHHAGLACEATAVPSRFLRLAHLWPFAAFQLSRPGWTSWTAGCGGGREPVNPVKPVLLHPIVESGGSSPGNGLMAVNERA